MKCVKCGGFSITENENPSEAISLLGIPSLCPKHYAEFGLNYQFTLGINIADEFLERAKNALKIKR